MCTYLIYIFSAISKVQRKLPPTRFALLAALSLSQDLKIDWIFVEIMLKTKPQKDFRLFALVYFVCLNCKYLFLLFFFLWLNWVFVIVHNLLVVVASLTMEHGL